jgi:hypothetical protein
LLVGLLGGLLAVFAAGAAFLVTGAAFFTDAFAGEVADA